MLEAFRHERAYQPLQARLRFGQDVSYDILFTSLTGERTNGWFVLERHFSVNAIG